MFPHHTSPLPRNPSSLSSRQQQSFARYHPYMALRRCRFPEESVSPSPPAMALDCSGWPPATKGIDYFSSLPQELIEEIGLLTCATPYTGDSSELFQAERHRLRSLYALCLVSKQFSQIFTRPLYTEPFIIDTQHARSLRLPNSAMGWLSPSCHDNASVAKRFTLWRPRSEEMRKCYLCPINPFVMLFMLSNIRELTFAGNFKNRQPKEGSSSTLPWTEATLVPQYVPHLTSVRVIDVDDPELINILLIGVAHQITSMVIHPASSGVLDTYSPRSVYSMLRQTIEKLTALNSFSISLPGLKGAINHCNHAHKLIQKSLVNLPNKDKVKSLAIALPPFDCRSMPWTDASDSEDDQDPKSVDHAWFWMTFQNVLSGFTTLKTLSFTGSYVPEEIRRKLQIACSGTTMSFTTADRPRSEPPSSSPVLPTIPFAVPAPPMSMDPPTPTNRFFPFSFSARPPTIAPLYPSRASTDPWGQQYPSQSNTFNQSNILNPSASFASFLDLPYPGAPESFGSSLQDMIFQPPLEANTNIQRESTPDDESYENDGSSTMQTGSQTDEWDWYIKYD